MKKRIALLLAILTLFSLCAVAAADDGPVAVSESSLYVKPLKDNKYSTWVIGALTNEGNAPVRITNIYIELMDASGNVFVEKKTGNVWPSTIGPGETAWFNASNQISDVTDPSLIAEYRIRVETDDKAQTIVYLDAADEPQITTNSQGVTDAKHMITVHNQTSELAYSPTICYQVFDREGALLYAYTETFSHVGIPADQSILFTASTDTTLEAVWTELGRTAASVGAVAYCKN